MGQSFLDKQGLYQPIKIPLSLICWLLQAPGNRWKGGQKKAEDKGGMIWGGRYLGQGERKAQGFTAQKIKNVL